MAQISLYGATVAYPVVTSARQRSAFASAATSAARNLGFGRVGGSGSGVDYVVAVNNLSIQIKNGSRVGLIGRNGSGKSTLLRTMAGIIHPMRGTCDVTGSIGCLLAFGAGLDPEKTGVENLKLIGRLYGLTGAALKTAVEEAAEFTELGPFLQMPVRTYSAGMSARLSFAIATERQAEVMLIDEVIGTGDAHFVHKAVERIKVLCSNSGIVVVATHSYEILKSFCDEAIWMNAGVMRMRGPVDEVWAAYHQEQ
jgi:ABC-type polysaccharide/polyol phosphate transport system ATPase subunit